MKIKLLHLIGAILLFGPWSLKLSAQTNANFSANKISGCAPLTVIFTDLSTGNPASRVWNFGNGNSSTNPAPPISAVYSNPGTYTVTLTVTGDATPKTATITVFANPIANFTINSTPSCVGQTITFTNSSTPGSGTINGWAWDFGDGSGQPSGPPTVTHAYANPGSYPISLMVTDNNTCTNLKNLPGAVTILAAPVASFSGSPLSSCTTPLTVNFTNTSTSGGTASYLWNFGDGTATSTQTAPTHTYTTTGTFTVMLIITQGACKDTIIKPSYVIVQSTAANFAANNTTVCVNSAVTFTDLSVPLSTTRTWSFPGGVPSTSTLQNPAVTYFTPGTYSVTLNATANGCSDSEVKTNYITVVPPPVVNFKANDSTSCKVPFSVIFTNTSTNGTTWSWNFGDGTTSTLQNPTHVYNAPGTYSVTLTATSAAGCTKTFTKPNYIKISPPVANFTANPHEGCIPLPITFTSTSTSSQDAITTYLWNFGIGQGTATTATPTTNHTYTAQGFYNVQLIVVTASGCRDTTIVKVKAGTKPTANFTIVDSTVCYRDTTFFNDLSTGADSVFWNFGIGQGTYNTALPYTSPHPYNVYNTPDTNTVTLIAYNKGCPDTLKQTDIAIILPAKAVFSFHLNCINPYLVTFTDASIGADSLVWNFGDGTPFVSNILTPSHTFATTGSKTVKIIAYNLTTGCTDSITASFTITDPIARFTTPVPGCYPYLVNISNTSQDASSALWNFGDGSANSVSPIHTYALPGAYNVRLIITDINGCKDTVNHTATVWGAIPNFVADTLKGCAPLPILFTDTSVSDSTLSPWKWNFGDGTPNQTTVLSSISHTYAVPGFYTVKMVVTDKNGCADSLTRVNYIKPTFPYPSFVTDTFACVGDILTFNASGTSVANPSTFQWNFGDGTTGTGMITTHAFTSESLFNVTLTVTDVNGCDSTIHHNVLIQSPTVAFSNVVITEGCGFTNVQFNDLSTGTGITNWQWNFGDGATATTQNPTHSYTSPGTYDVTLTATNSQGCSASLAVDSMVVVAGPLGTFTFSPSSGCNPLTVSFVASSNNTDTYTWDFGDGTVITTTNGTIQHTYTQDINVTPILILTNTLSNGSPCQLSAPTAGPVIVSTLMNVDIDSTIIVLEEEETVTVNSNVTGVIGSPVYSWAPADGLSCTNCQSPTITGNSSGQTITYILTVTDPASGGCIASDSVTIVFPVCNGDNLVVPNVFTPNGDSNNDLFDIKGLCAKNTYLIKIFNRWGAEIFKSESRKISWDGKMKNGNDAVEGVYYYIILLDGKSHTGFVQLIR